LPCVGGVVVGGVVVGGSVVGVTGGFVVGGGELFLVFVDLTFVGEITEDGLILPPTPAPTPRVGVLR
jgi:hypothetical protein